MRGIVLALAALFIATPMAGPPGNRGFDVEKLADGVYAVVRREPAGLAVHANNLVVVNSDHVVVVDTSQSTSLTRDVIAAIRALTPLPVRFVVNTHWHDDHYIGNQAYRDAFPAVKFIGHAVILEELPADGANNRRQMVEAIPPMVARLRDLVARKKNMAGADMTDEERTAYESDIEWAERYVREVPAVPLITPDIPVRDRYVLDAGGRTIEIESFGPGHSQADLVVRLPKEHIVAAGDLVIWPIPLAGLKSSIRNWPAALERIVALKPAVIVPGHGPLMRDTAYLMQMAGMFAALRTQVDTAAARGETLDQVRKSVNLEDWSGKFSDQSQLRRFLFSYYVIGPGVAAAYREATEKP